MSFLNPWISLPSLDYSLKTITRYIWKHCFVIGLIRDRIRNGLSGVQEKAVVILKYVYQQGICCYNLREDSNSYSSLSITVSNLQRIRRFMLSDSTDTIVPAAFIGFLFSH